ncbi:MAG: hypothetical protein KGH55_03170 [Nanoarchaeota archaeon]|nr:hypothetical protein [Nanoarchaeota archaeon]
MKKRNFLLILFACLLITQMHLFSAQLIISVTSLTNEAGQSSQINVSINNTNTAPLVNITQLNITLSPSFNVSTSSGDSNIFGSISQNYNNITINQSTGGVVPIGSLGFYWVNVTNPRSTGNFNVNVSVLDNNSVMSWSNFTFPISDTIAPSVNFVSPTPSSGSTINTSYLPVNLTASDFGSGLKNITVYLYNSSSVLVQNSSGTSSPLFYNFTSLANGTYYINATAFDNAGNSNSTPTISMIVNFSISVSCTPNWSTSWGNCINGTQTQIVTDLNSCNVTTGQPTAQTQICNDTTGGSCSETGYNCTDYAPINCTSGENQTRICTDSTGCQITQTTPCALTSAQTNSPQSGFGSISPSLAVFSIVGILVIIAFVAIMFLIKMKKKSSSNAGNMPGYQPFPPKGPPSGPPPMSPPNYSTYFQSNPSTNKFRGYS